MRKTLLSRLLALAIVLVMVTGSAGAASVKVGETISGTKWINSDIIGAIDENTPVSVKDDFHTAVNRDWLLTSEETSPFDSSEKLLYERKLEIVMGDATIDPANADAIGLSSEWLAHDLKLLQTFASLSGEWEYRNARGVEPARPYLEAIESIQTMDEMTAYILNENGLNISGFSLVDVTIMPDLETKSVYCAALSPQGSFSLSNQDEYLCLLEVGRGNRFALQAAADYLLPQLGYETEQIEDLLVKAFRFEGRLAASMNDSLTQQTHDYVKSGKPYTQAETEKLAGAYPLAEQIKAWGLDGEETILVYEKHYFKQLGKLYQERYLEEMKAMAIVHTMVKLYPLLDEPTYDRLTEIQAMVNAIPKLDESDEPVGQHDHHEDEADKEKDLGKFVFDNYIAEYLSEPLDQIYVAAYCTPELKQEISGIIDDAIAYYREMILDVTWLSQNAREATVEKLENLIIRSVYPDRFADYTGLTLVGCRDGQPGTLPQAVAAIDEFNTARELEKVGQPVERSYWDMSGHLSTTVTNAYYMPTENSINILAGILTEAMYEPDFTYEEKLGTIGVVIGHEITHAFDTSGYQYDKDGNRNPWWQIEDVESFDLRASDLIKYYSALTPYPGAVLYNGSNVSGEAIADMGGLKCMLGIAADIPDFDYDAFFSAYARMWRVKQDLKTEQMVAGDVHPLAFLRTNVTVQQFDEFMETYDIQPGDGMYLAPEDRISVW